MSVEKPVGRGEGLLDEAEWDGFARDIGVESPEDGLARAVGLDPPRPGAPGFVPGTAVLRLDLRTYLAAMALHGDDAARVLAHLGVATRSQTMTYTMVALDSRLVEETGHLTQAGWDVLRALSPR